MISTLVNQVLAEISMGVTLNGSVCVRFPQMSTRADDIQFRDPGYTISEYKIRDVKGSLNPNEAQWQVEPSSS